MQAKIPQVNAGRLHAIACDGEVVIFCAGPKPVEGAFTPEAILDSLGGLKAAAENALAQREAALVCPAPN